MNIDFLQKLAQRLLAGEVAIEEFVSQVAQRPLATARLADSTLDLDRARRCGYPEVIYGEGKSVETLRTLFAEFAERQIDALATRIDAGKADALAQHFPQAEYNPVGRTFRLPSDAVAGPTWGGRVVIVTAGASDRPAAEEALETARWMGAQTHFVADVGVAGPHRLPERLAEIRGADAVVVAAGMEGALPSVVGGYLDCPVIALPTSVGYGASFGGLTALLGMLNSCAANVAVVNIDAGFKAGYLAALIANRAAAPPPSPEAAAISGSAGEEAREIDQITEA